MAGEIDLRTVSRAAVLARVDRSSLNGCWPWRGGRGTNGYGYVSRGRRRPKLLAHRVVYTMLIGPIPDGLPLDHLCRNRACVNPAHLEPVTLRENTLRGNSPSAMHARQTHCTHGHEFTEENTRRIGRRRQCRTCCRIADRKRPSGWERQRRAEGARA